MRDPVGEHARAVGRLPAEERALERLLLAARAAGRRTSRMPLFAQDLRDRRVVPERVDVRAGRRDDPERVAQVALAVERLPHERLAAGDVAVRLDPPAADRPGSGPRRSARGSRSKSARVALLDPLEEERRVAGEDEVRVLVHPVDRRLEGGAHLLVALRPLPQPHRVDVRVADHVQERVTSLIRPAAQRVDLRR